MKHFYCDIMGQPLVRLVHEVIGTAAAYFILYTAPYAASQISLCRRMLGLTRTVAASALNVKNERTNVPI